MNEAITIAALIVGAVQVVFLYNLFWSYFNGKPSGGNPWRATTLEWQTPDTPPKHGNFGPELPVVYRWAYDYSVPGAAEDFIPQNQPPAKGSSSADGSAAAQAASSRMTTALVLLSAIMAIVVGWLVRHDAQRLAVASSRAPIEIARGNGEFSMPPVQVGLGVFLAVATSLFALLISAYHMRMMEADWTNVLPADACCGSTPGCSCSRASRCRWTRTRRATGTVSTASGKGLVGERRVQLRVSRRDSSGRGSN